jgi:hypothetical protein
MTEDEFNWPYWSVDLPGIGCAQAEELLAMAVKAGMSFGGTAVDPNYFLTLQLDRFTVEALYRALSPAERDLATKGTEGRVAFGVREMLKEWLDGLPVTIPGSGEAGPETMTENQFGRPYWSVDLPWIGRAQAEEFLAMAVKAGMPFGGTAVDPSEFFTIHLDRSTVEVMYRALSPAEKDEGSATAAWQGFAAVREVLKEWLDQNPD